MVTILKTKSIYFNDVNLIPNLGCIKSRRDVPNELHRIIVSPMLAIVGETFTKEAAKLGLSIATPRFISMDNKIKLCALFAKNRISDKQSCFLSVGINEAKEDLEKLSHNKNHREILFDIANGYVPQLEDKIKDVYNKIGLINSLMTGNVVTDIGVRNLANNLNHYCNKLFIRVGIGNGSPCSSSDVAAINRGQITELTECSKEKKYFDKIRLVSDGGISKSGFCLKAFGAGANYCLMGGYFSKALEAETHISGDGIYFGCASEKQNKLAGLNKNSEGKEFKVDKEELKSLKYLVEELQGGIASGISYSGHSSVSEFIGNGTFEIKINSLPPKNRK